MGADIPPEKGRNQGCPSIHILANSVFWLIMGYWILVMMGSREDFLKRTGEKKWPIFKNTPHKQSMTKGDNVVFYLGGKGNMEFIGRALLGSPLVKDDGDSLYVTLDDIKVWKKPLPIRKILDILEFIHKKRHWGIYMQGGVVRLPSKDFSTILSNAKK